MQKGRIQGKRVGKCRPVSLGKTCFILQRAEAENSVLPGGVEMYIVFLDLSE